MPTKVGKRWNASKLNSNYSTSNFMLFTNQKIKSKFKLEMNNNDVTESDSVKYLGVIIDYRLIWKTHIEHICSKLTQCLFTDIFSQSNDRGSLD